MRLFSPLESVTLELKETSNVSFQMLLADGELRSAFAKRVNRFLDPDDRVSEIEVVIAVGDLETNSA